MGNMWRCCIYSSRYPINNRIHPATNSGILGLEDRRVDGVSTSSPTSECSVVKDPTTCPYLGVFQDDEISEIIRETASRATPKLQQETELRNKGNQVFEKEENMEEWMTSIVKRNALLPSYVSFNNRRHLSMRSKFTEMIQKMNYSTTITESKEEKGVWQQQENTISFGKANISNHPQTLDKLYSQFSVNLVPDGQNRSSYNTVEVVSPRSSVTKTTHQVENNLPDSPPRTSARSAGDDSTESYFCNHSTEGTSDPSEFPGKPFQISSNWLDEDFEENILSDPLKAEHGCEETLSTHEQPARSTSAAAGSSHEATVHEATSHLQDASDEPSAIIDSGRKLPNDGDKDMHTMDMLFSPTTTSRSVHLENHRFSKMFKKKSRSSTFYNTKDLSWRR